MSESAQPRVVLLTRHRPEAFLFANALRESGCLAGVVVERSPIPFAQPRRRRPPLRSPEGKRWIVAQLRGNMGAALAIEPVRILFDAVGWRIAEAMERQFIGGGRSTLRRPVPGTAGFPDDVARYEVDNLNDPDAIALLTSLAPELFIVVATRILSEQVIAIPPRGAINWHPGILPGYRGVYCEFFALYNHDFENVGSTFHYVTTGVDTGDIVWMCTVRVDRDDDYHTLRNKNMEEAAKALPGIVTAITTGTASRRPQEGKGRQYFMRDVSPARKIRMISELVLRRWGCFLPF